MINTEKIDKMIGLIGRIIFGLLALPCILVLFVMGLIGIIYLHALDSKQFPIFLTIKKWFLIIVDWFANIKE